MTITKAGGSRIELALVRALSGSQKIHCLRFLQVLM